MASSYFPQKPLLMFLPNKVMVGYLSTEKTSAAFAGKE